MGPLLTYQDGGSFLRLTDRRQDYEVLTLPGLTRDVYLYCMLYQARDRVAERFAGCATEEEIGDILDGLVGEALMYSEGSKYLALAAAPNPRIAARRILAQHEEQAEKRRLRVVES
jgi:hypothetical protein